MHGSRRAVTALLSAFGVAAAIVATAPSALAAPAVDCIQNPATDSNITGGSFLGTNINIRTGPFTVCTAVGAGQPSHAVTVHCKKVNSNGVLWDYLTDRHHGKERLVGGPVRRLPAGSGQLLTRTHSGTAAQADDA